MRISGALMTPLNHQVLDTETFADAVRRLGVPVMVMETEDLCGLVPHVGYGGAAKSMYTSAKTGKPVYVLERNGFYAPDAYQNDVWQFDTDFSPAEAADFLRSL